MIFWYLEIIVFASLDLPSKLLTKWTFCFLKSGYSTLITLIFCDSGINWTFSRLYLSSTFTDSHLSLEQWLCSVFILWSRRVRLLPDDRSWWKSDLLFMWLVWSSTDISNWELLYNYNECLSLSKQNEDCFLVRTGDSDSLVTLKVWNWLVCIGIWTNEVFNTF